MLSRGDLWWVELPASGPESSGEQRPCVIVSADSFNASAMPTVTVLLVYSNLKLARHAGNVVLPASETGLDRDSIANVAQIRTVERQQLLRRIGQVSIDTMREIDAGVQVALGL